MSLRLTGTAALGTKTELKNLNSIKGVEKGIAAEIERQRQLLERGERIVQSTLLYDADHDRLAVMRTKEYAHDYRYFPEPDLPVLNVSAEWIAEARTRLPELPWDRERRWIEQYALPAYDAAVLMEQRELADYFEACAGREPKLASNWIMTEVLRALKERGWTLGEWTARVPVPRMTEFLGKVAARELPGPMAKQVFAWMADEDGDVATLLERHGVRVEGSADALRPLIAEVLAAHPDVVRQFLGGKTATLGFLVGQVMKKSAGQAVPQVVQELMREALEHARVL